MRAISKPKARDPRDGGGDGGHWTCSDVGNARHAPHQFRICRLALWRRSILGNNDGWNSAERRAAPIVAARYLASTSHRPRPQQFCFLAENLRVTRGLSSGTSAAADGCRVRHSRYDCRMNWAAKRSRTAFRRRLLVLVSKRALGRLGR